MDNLMRDPEIAPQLLKLLNDKLQDTRRELETVKKVCNLSWNLCEDQR